jgi:hypothetical protein
MKTALIALLVFFARIASPAAAAPVIDGQQDFNWEIGVWQTKLQRLKQPLSGNRQWLEYAGTTTVTPLLDKRANIVELDVQGPAGRIAGVSLRLFQPATGQWTLHFANLANGSMTEPMQGSFKQGRGTFFGHDELNGRKILVRFLIIPVSAAQWRFEQAFSADEGKTWEDNWIAVDTRQPPPPSAMP